MSSDGRYNMYSNQPNISTPYEYSAYPPVAYDASQIPPQPPIRPIRGSPSQPHAQSPHHQATFNPPPPPGQQYGAPPPPSYAYNMPPQNGSWNGGSWDSYNQQQPLQQTYAPPPSIPDTSYSTGPGRAPEVAPLPPDPRRYAPPTPEQHPDIRRQDERYGRPTSPAVVPSQQIQPRRREKDASTPNIAPPPPPIPIFQVDYTKLIESYQAIIDSSGSLANSNAPPQDMERMLQSATYGALLLESAISQQQSAQANAARVTSQVELKASPESAHIAVSKMKLAPEEETVPEGQKCLGCSATNTPEWRRGPMGPRTLCNACGLVYAKLLKKRNKGSQPSSKKALHANGDESESSSSEGENSFSGSHGRRSEVRDPNRRE